MSFFSRHTYACPCCYKSFAKWGLCQAHVRSSASCRETCKNRLRELEQDPNDPDELQEICRSAACALPEETALIPTSEEKSGTALSHAALNAETRAAPGLSMMTEVEAAPGLEKFEASVPVPTILTDTRAAPGLSIEPGNFAPAQRPPWPLANSLAPATNGSSTNKSVAQKLDKAVVVGILTKLERKSLNNCLEDLSRFPIEQQSAAIEQFFALGSASLRKIASKKKWLLQCVAFSTQVHSGAAAKNDGPGINNLRQVFRAHALLPDDNLSRICLEKYVQLEPSLKERVAESLRCSVLANLVGSVADHFMHIILNEEAIYRLLAKSADPATSAQPATFSAPSGDESYQYQRFLAFARTGGEEQMLRNFAILQTPDPNGQIAGFQCLLRGLALAQASIAHYQAEAASPLHVVASAGYERVCLRLILEGFDPNLQASEERVSPLHSAAANAEISTAKVLLDLRADVNFKDRKGQTALHTAVNAALSQPRRRQYLKFCGLLLAYGAVDTPESEEEADISSAESLAARRGLNDLRNAIRLHRTFKRMQVPRTCLVEFSKLQFETATFLIHNFAANCNVSTVAASTELSALISSEFIQDRDRIQRLGNRLAQKLGLSKTAIDALVELPPAAAMAVLKTWKVEETTPESFQAPEHLNAGALLKPSQVNGAKIPSEDGGANAAPQATLASDGTTKLLGTVRKWDSERGFGFIVQDPLECETVGADIFVHRKNIVGSTSANHVDLTENCRVSFMLGEQDNRPRALEVTMLDIKGNVAPIHMGKNGDAYKANLKTSILEALPLDIEPSKKDISWTFMRHMLSPEVQEIANEKRFKFDVWMRCVGLRKNTSGRRDDSICKKEVDRRIDIFLSRGPTPLEKKDFDWGVRRELAEMAVQGCVFRVSEALIMVEKSTAAKKRDDIRSPSAYIARLLKNFTPRNDVVQDWKPRLENARAVNGQLDCHAAATEPGEDTFAGNGGVTETSSILSDSHSSVSGTSAESETFQPVPNPTSVEDQCFLKQAYPGAYEQRPYQ